MKSIYFTKRKNGTHERIKHGSIRLSEGRQGFTLKFYPRGECTDQGARAKFLRSVMSDVEKVFEDRGFYVEETNRRAIK